MTKISLLDLPEVFVSNTSLTKSISRYVKEGKLRKLASRLYTKNLIDPPELIVKRNLWPIIGGYFPGGLIADRTALENKPTPDGLIFLISEQKNKIKIPGITLCPRKGHGPLKTDQPFIGDLFLSSTPRAFLENIKLSRSRDHLSPRTLSQKELEERLEEVLRRGGPESLNKIRDDAEKISTALDLSQEFKILNKLIGSLLGTQDMALQSPRTLTRKSGFAYDPHRLDLFSELHTSLISRAPVSRIAPNLSPTGLVNLSFFEAYFSNFIEGTEFELQEAVEIIFEGKIPLNRPEDAHDILGTFKIVGDSQEMAKVPSHFEGFLDLLKIRHASIMEGRPDKRPGEFKKEVNRAGSTTFVSPELVIGTLKQGFDLYRSLDCPLYKAIFMMFLVSEVHPFTDGNGRLARIMMNAELVSKSEQRIIIPTVYRNNYLSSLRALSLNHLPDPLIRVLDFAQKYTLSIDYSEFTKANIRLQQTHAFLDSNEAEERGLRLTIPST